MSVKGLSLASKSVNLAEQTNLNEGNRQSGKERGREAQVQGAEDDDPAEGPAKQRKAEQEGG